MIEGKRLYTTWDVSTEDGNELCRRAEELLKPLMLEWTERGFSIRDIAHEIHSSVAMLEAETCLLRNFNAHERGEKAPSTKG